MQDSLFALRWWLVLELLGLIIFPLVACVGRNLWDKGYGIAKPISLLLLTYLVWIISSLKLMRFGYASILVSLCLLGALSFYLGRKYLGNGELHIKRMALVDAIFLASFILFALILRGKPDLYFAYSEKFVDFAFTKALLRSDYFPPQDPWMATRPISYYYGGFLIVANLIKISRIPASFAPNLAMATFFAIAVTAAYGLGTSLARSKTVGILAAILICVMGYLSGAFQLAAFMSKKPIMGYKALEVSGWRDWFLSFNFWDAGRIVPGTLNYYPYFSLLQSDMHPPNMSFPFQVTFLVLIAALAKADFRRPLTEALILILLIAVNLGFLFFIHSWDYPVYAMVLALAVLLLKRGIRYWVMAAAIVLWSFVLFLPYHLGGIGGGFQGIGLVSERTDLSGILEIMPVFLLILSSMLFLMAKKANLPLHWLVLSSSLLALAISVFKFPLLVILVPFMGLAVYFIGKRDTSEQERLFLFFTLAGAIVIFFAEVFYLKDSLRGPVARFNTVLKLYYGLWLFWGLASAIAVKLVMTQLKGIPRYVWLSLTALLILASLVHPVASTTGWTSGRHKFFGISRGTLDSTAYLASLHPADYEAINWLDRNIQGTPVILEAPGAPYAYSSRVASLTGLPTVIGWGMHEIMWRGDWVAVEQRTNDVNAIYESRDGEQVVGLLGKYGVKYIFVGEVERQKYSREGLAKFGLRPDLFKLIYDKGGVQVYEVIYG